MKKQALANACYCIIHETSA